MGGKLYESVVAAEAASRADALRTQAVQWKARANQFRDPNKVRFCEGRMAIYRDQLDTLTKGQ